MKKILFALLLALTFSAPARGQGLLDALRSIVGTAEKAVTGRKEVVLPGSWNYGGCAVGVSSDDLLASIAGNAVSAKVEAKLDEYLLKIGMERGRMQFCFKDNGRMELTLGKAVSEATWWVENGNITFQFGKDMAYLQLSGTVSSSGERVKILFPADGFVKFAGELVKNLSQLAELASQIEGMEVGFYLEKLQ